MIEVIHKIHTEPNNPLSVYTEVTLDSIANQAIHIRCPLTNQIVVIYSDQIEAFIESIRQLEKYL